MYIDYVRVYQRDDAPGIGCSPDDYPTEDYINKYELFSFYIHPRKLTRRQTFECLHESQSHNVESSRVLLPAQLDIPRLLDPRATASVSNDFTLFPHERHDMFRSLAQVLEIPFVSPVVTNPIFSTIRHGCTDRSPTIRGTHDTHIIPSRIRSTYRPSSTRTL